MPGIEKPLAHILLHYRFYWSSECAPILFVCFAWRGWWREATSGTLVSRLLYPKSSAFARLSEATISARPLLRVYKGYAMQRQPGQSTVIEHALVGSAFGTESDGARKDKVSPPALVQREQRPAVLAVTPTEVSRAALVTCLSASEYEVWAVCRGREALELAEHTSLDAVLLDLDGSYEAGLNGTMISGFRLLYLLWRLTRGRPVAIVVTTSMDYAEVEGQIQANADDFVNKSVAPAQLLCRIRAALERVRRRHQGTFAPGPCAWRDVENAI